MELPSGIPRLNFPCESVSTDRALVAVCFCMSSSYEPPVNRYSDMAGPEAMKLWEQTFKMFDRDGGGDVDLRELGLMFRQLGQTPTERQMLLLIEEVDADGSGTVDFEEFCCLMLRQQRALRVPAWLDALLPALPIAMMLMHWPKV